MPHADQMSSVRSIKSRSLGRRRHHHRGELGHRVRRPRNGGCSLAAEGARVARKAEPRAAADTALLAQLAQYYDALGQGERAQALYERVLKLEPGHVAAGTNVGVYWAQSGRGAEAIALWEKIAASHPGMTSVAMNLAVAQYRVGRKAAVATLERHLRFQPDLDTARRLLGEMQER